MEEKIPADIEDCEEKLASQEEIYMEETEEELRAILISDDSKAKYWRSVRETAELGWDLEISVTGAKSDSRIAPNLDGQPHHAAEDLAAGDSDVAPFSEKPGVI